MIELRPIKETTSDYEAIEVKIRDLLKREIYLPMLRALGESHLAIKNDDSALKEALRSGKITYNRGIFSGRFNSSLSKELKSLGARWDRKHGTWNVPQSALPVDIRNAISQSENAFKLKLAKIDKQLAEVQPAEIAGRLNISNHFETALWRVDKDFRQSVKNITIAPSFSPEMRSRIAKEWSNNMQLWVKEFTENEIKDLRQTISQSAFSGNRYGSVVKTIQDSYGVTQSKAKFLARQETSLLMTKFKQTRYEEAGVKSYKWGCVAGSKNHPVRPWHKALEGKIFQWQNPPITTAPGESVRRCNPGQDYNCRCFAKPIVNFREK